jgi:hypothetical protein
LITINSIARFYLHWRCAYRGASGDDAMGAMGRGGAFNTLPLTCGSLARFDHAIMVVVVVVQS